MKILKTTSEVIDALGGNQAVVAALDASSQVVSNWRFKNRFPANSYIAFAIILGAHNLHADAKLWPMRFKRRKKK